MTETQLQALKDYIAAAINLSIESYHGGDNGFEYTKLYEAEDFLRDEMGFNGEAE